MNYNHSSTKEKWTIMMYMRDFNLMTAYAYALRESNQLTKDNIVSILESMEDKKVYRPRYGGSVHTGEFKSIQIAWYMFGSYKKNANKKKGEEKKMVFSPLGNLLLDNLSDADRRRKIFATMLFGLGFRQPFSQMDSRFNIYGYRLIFKLLLDERLDNKLYDDEVFYLVMFLKEIDETSYEELVQDILSLRKRNPYEKLTLFKKDEAVVGLACHEWRYAVGMLTSAGIVTSLDDKEAEVIGSLEYGSINPKTGKHNAVRHYRVNYISLNDSLVTLVKKLFQTYPYYEKPYPDDLKEKMKSEDLVSRLYLFYPNELLEEIGIQDSAISLMYKTVNDVNYYAKNETSGGEAFEFALRDAFKLFVDVEAERIGGSDNVDVECIYINNQNLRKKFDLECKATAKKLSQVNPRRLHAHRIKVGSKYTIVITPDFVLGVVKDIENTDAVVLKSSTLSNYMFQYIREAGRNISYSALDEIVNVNLGKDITPILDKYIENQYGHKAIDMKV